MPVAGAFDETVPRSVPPSRLRPPPPPPPPLPLLSPRGGPLTGLTFRPRESPPLAAVGGAPGEPLPAAGTAAAGDASRDAAAAAVATAGQADRVRAAGAPPPARRVSSGCGCRRLPPPRRRGAPASPGGVGGAPPHGRPRRSCGGHSATPGGVGQKKKSRPTATASRGRPAHPPPPPTPPHLPSPLSPTLRKPPTPRDARGGRRPPRACRPCQREQEEASPGLKPRCLEPPRRPPPRVLQQRPHQCHCH